MYCKGLYCKGLFKVGEGVAERLSQIGIELVEVSYPQVWGYESIHIPEKYSGEFIFEKGYPAVPGTLKLRKVI